MTDMMYTSEILWGDDAMPHAFVTLEGNTAQVLRGQGKNSIELPNYPLPEMILGRQPNYP